MDRREHGVGVLAGAAATSVGSDVAGAGVPVRLTNRGILTYCVNIEKRMVGADLEEAEKVVRLRGVAGHNRCLADAGSEGGTLAKRTVLDGGGEERRGVDLFPEIEAMESKCKHR